MGKFRKASDEVVEIAEKLIAGVGFPAAQAAKDNVRVEWVS